MRLCTGWAGDSHAGSMKLAVTYSPTAPMTAHRAPCLTSDLATSTISRTDGPGAPARMRRCRVSRRVLAGITGNRKLRHQLASRNFMECCATGGPMVSGTNGAERTEDPTET